MGFRLLNPGDDLEEWIGHWRGLDEYGRYETVALHRRRVKELSKDPSRLKEYMKQHTSLMFALSTRDKYHFAHRLSFHEINREMEMREFNEGFGVFLKRAAIVAAIGLGIYVVASVATSKRTPEHILRQMHPYDPADDPRSDSNGYHTRGL